jgi:hypothetical protein
MAVQGLDRATAPTADMAKRMLDQIGGRWWNVYIGGPESGGHGWSPALVKEYVRHGIEHFMLTYVGRQHHGPLTTAQGKIDAVEALRIAAGYGYSSGFPLCLDVEIRTFNSAPSQTVEYAKAWCATVRSAGARPGVYANPAPLKAMAQGKVPADFVWVASWLSHGPAPHDPHAIPQLPGELWPRPGERAWQYAGAYDNRPCQVLGLDVDINVADLGCLAPAPGRAHGHVATGARLVRRGDSGPAVERLTRRLSFVRSESTGHPYLDGARGRLGPDAEAALKAFQREHRLDPDGVYGADTQHALARAIQHERARRQHGPEDAPGKRERTKTNGQARKRPTSLRGLVDDVRRLDAETDRAWQRLVAYGASRRQLAGQAGSRAPDPNMVEITAILRRMEHTLEALVTLEQHELALEHPPAAEPVAAASEAGAVAAESAGATVASESAGATVATTITTGGNGAAAVSPLGAPAAPPVRLDELTDEQLQARINRLDRAISRSRVVLMRRYVEADRALGTLAPERRVRPEVRRAPDPVAPPDPQRPKRAHTEPRQVKHRPKRPAPAEHIKDLQSTLNRFTGKYLEGVSPLMVDGVAGPATTKRIRRAKYYLGYRGPEQRSSEVTPKLLKRLARPRSPRLANPAMLARALSRRGKQHKLAVAAAAPAAGVSTFDGKPVAAWLKPYLDWARAHGWQGTLNSGYRTPEYSEHLCIGMCGATSCPGKCAGRSSHHSIRVKPGGAIDVSDFAKFGELMRQCPYSPRIFNNLPTDQVHYSSSGN